MTEKLEPEYLLQNEDTPNSKFTQTFDKEAKFREEVVEHSVAVPVGEPSDELNQVTGFCVMYILKLDTGC